MVWRGVHLEAAALVFGVFVEAIAILDLNEGEREVDQLLFV